MSIETTQIESVSAQQSHVLKDKRIIIVLGHLAMGGAQRQAILLASYLAHRANANVEVWGFQEVDGAAISYCEQLNIPWRVFPLHCRSWRPTRLRWIKEWARLAMALRRERPDIILPYYIDANLACGLVWRLTGAKVCVWNQRDMGLSIPTVKERWSAWLTNCFVSNSVVGANFLVGKYGVKTEDIHVVNNGVELATPKGDRSTWRTQLGIADNQFVACMIANLHSAKDHKTLIKAWRLVVDRLAPSGNKPLLLLAGRHYDYTNSLLALTNELHLNQHIRFLGHIDDISGLLEAVDFGIFSSNSEGCPNGVLECMAAGLAVVATDVEGISAAIGPTDIECLVEPQNPEAMADRIVEFISDPDKRRLLGNANRARINRDFSPQRMYEQMVNILAPFIHRG